ncbi:MAG: pilin [Patescibacteria group bacterium]
MLNSKTLTPLIAFLTPLFANAEKLTLNYKELLDLKCTTIPACLELLFKAAVDVAFPIAVVFILWSGFLFVSAGGNPEKIKTARTTLLWALIGLTVVIGAWTLSVAFKDSFLGL